MGLNVVGLLGATLVVALLLQPDVLEEFWKGYADNESEIGGTPGSNVETQLRVGTANCVENLH